jgi:D-sedoheptulose 7-phosphate isomerase
MLIQSHTASEQLVAARIRDSVAAQEGLLEPDRLAGVVAAAALITRSMREGGKVLLFGNGGSAADAEHIAAEFLGRYLMERRPLPAVALTDTGATVTAIGNDYGFDDIFSRQVLGLGKPGDVAVGISTSGTSANVLAGVAAARSAGLHTIGLTGGDGGQLRDEVDVCLVVPSDHTPHIQEGHTLVAHLICELVERDLATSRFARS